MPAGAKSHNLLDHFSALRDPRENWRVVYPLPEILLLVLCATLSGMEDFVEVRLWGEQRLDFLRRFLPFERGLPAHDTINDLINALDAELFKTLFANWVEMLRQADPDIIAIDGKTLRGSGRGKLKPLHLVSAWASDNQLTLGQVACAEKSNEITAIPELLDLLCVKGALVTIDAMGCQKEIAAKIRAGDGDYILAVKDNQPTLHADIQDSFISAFEADFKGLDYDQFETRAVPRAERRGAWSQTVYQVDDSPRYGSLGRWVHSDEASIWEGGDAWRPLPRREHSVRSDYQVLAGRNRHTILPTGWVMPPAIAFSAIVLASA